MATRTSFRWEIENFKSQWLEAREDGKEHLSSKLFSLSTRPWIEFFLFFETEQDFWVKNYYGISIKNYGKNKAVKVHLKIWFEDEEKQKYIELSMTKEFQANNKPNHCGWYDFNGFAAPYQLRKTFNDHKTLYICCELTDYDECASYLNNFVKNQLKLFEEGVSDTVIKVGKNKTEFKVLKAFFMAQSPVFKTMFQSDFKEAKENVVEIESIDEKTMEALIKWLCTSKIEKDSPVEKLFEVADIYQMELLTPICVKRMISTLSIDNVLSRLALAALYKHEELKREILEYIDKIEKFQLAKCLMSPQWYEFVSEKPNAAEEISKLVLGKLEK